MDGCVVVCMFVKLNKICAFLCVEPFSVVRGDLLFVVAGKGTVRYTYVLTLDLEVQETNVDFYLYMTLVRRHDYIDY